MNPKIPIAIGVAGMLVAVGTSMANINGSFAGHPHLAYWFYAGAGALIVVAVLLAITPVHASGPRLMATHYGPAGDAPVQMRDGWHHGDRKKMTTQEVLQGKHLLGSHGLYVEIETEESALEITIGSAPIGTSSLQFKDYTLPRLTKADGRAFFEAWIERSPGSSLLGNGLRDEMIQQNMREIILPITYKDTEDRWYRSSAKIERDFQGLSVRPMGRERIRRPRRSA
jgi:hypothetical protein